MDVLETPPPDADAGATPDVSGAAQLRVVTVGHVDHGKSTLIGRLLHDTGNLADGKVAEMRAASERRGVAFEWSFVLDALQSERDQAITIDTTRIWTTLGGRSVVLIDAPGHREFVRNMVTGASDADGAILVVDAADGVSDQTRRHALLLELIGVRSVVVAVNKMDRVAYARERYDAIAAELRALLGRIGVVTEAVVPVVACDGDNVLARSEAMAWYAGPTVVEAVRALQPIRRHDGTELRLAVQGVVRRDLERIVVGRIEAGSLRVGDEIALSPATRVARVRSIESWPASGETEARAGRSVGFTLDAPVFVERGDIVSDVASAPPAATRFRARLLWLGARPLAVGDRLRLRVGTRLASVSVERFERVVDMETLGDGAADVARANDVAEVVLRSRDHLALDTVDRHPGLGRFIMLDGLDVVAGGTLLATLPDVAAMNLASSSAGVDRAARAARTGHRGAVLWLTGLPGSGKSTIAHAVERALHERGVASYVLDGDVVRAGLNRDLAFDAADRAENVRRVAEVANLFADAGLVTLVALISPRAGDRDRARAIVGDGFHEVYVRADAATCAERDPKGHYARARADGIAGFTGTTGDYDVPEAADLVVDTAALDVETAVHVVVRYALGASGATA